MDDTSGSYVPLQRVLRSVLQRFYLFAALVLLFGLAATFAVMRLPNTYVAEAELLLPSASRPDGALDPADSPQDNESVRTEVLLLQSEPLLRKTVQNLGLQDDAEFAGPAAAGSSVRAAVATWLRGGVSAPTGPEVDIARAVQQVGQLFSATRLGETHLIRVSFRSRSPATAQQVVNAVVRDYLATQTATKVTAMRDMQQLLTEPLKDLRDAARRSQENLERYRRANGLFELQDVPLISRRIAGLTEQLVLARAARAEAESRAEETGSAQGSRQEVAVQRAREEALDRELTRLKGEYDRQNQAQIQASALQREATTDQTLHTAFMERSKQLQLRMLTERPSATVVAWAQRPVFPAAPRRLLLLAVGALASFAGAVAVVLVLPTPRRRGLAMAAARSDSP